jgi:hypothetical protein
MLVRFSLDSYATCHGLTLKERTQTVWGKYDPELTKRWGMRSLVATSIPCKFVCHGHRKTTDSQSRERS